MFYRSILQIALLLCLSTTTLSLSYNMLRFQLSGSSLACKKFLQQLGGVPEDCLKDRMSFEVPEEIQRPQQFQKENATLVIHEMLQNIFGVFRRNFSSTGWNDTIVEHLLAQLFWQMDHLETMLEEKLEEENVTWGNSMSVMHLKSYYLRITQYLKAKEYSSCAWTIVRVEILRNFLFINRLIDYLRD
ncbi:interferon beta [Tupaia chinensis]|uniref:Interferon beta n=1 Tax=Tupaia chinensis TaxID=246437 RepID=L9LC61_TUPCH|nr:interferon beta [Tupaia chinensis]ELW72501.1 Interferon beta [Tupaia chinensis]